MKHHLGVLAAMCCALALTPIAIGETTGGKDPDPSLPHVTGIVVDEQGKPVAGIRVQDLSEEAPAVVTDASGRFDFRAAKPALSYLVLKATEAEAKGTRSGYHRFQDPTIVRHQPDCRIVLKPTISMTVKVKGARDAPIKDAAVGVEHQYSFVSTGKTDATGTAVLRIPADAEVRYVLALKAGEGFNYHENFLPENKYKKPESPPKEITIRLQGARRAQILAEDSSGKPIAGVTFAPWFIKIYGKQDDINISGSEPALQMSRTTDAAGIATFDWLPMDGVEDTPFLLRDSDQYHQPKDPHLTFTQVPKTDTPMLKTRLLRTVKLRGRVVMPDGKPAPGILIQAEGKGATNHYCRESERSGADGSFTFTLYPDQSYIIAVLDDDWAAKSITGLFLKEGATPADITLPLSKGTLIHGRVTQGPQHTLVPNETVTLVQKGASIEPPSDSEQAVFATREESLVRWTGTDSEGKYRIRVGPGMYEINGIPAADMQDLVVKEEPTIKLDLHHEKQ